MSDTTPKPARYWSYLSDEELAAARHEYLEHPEEPDLIQCAHDISRELAVRRGDRFYILQQHSGDWCVMDSRTGFCPICDETYALCEQVAESANGQGRPCTETGEVGRAIAST